MDEIKRRIFLAFRAFWWALRKGELPLDVALLPYLYPGSTKDLFQVYWHVKDYIVLAYTGPRGRQMHHLFQSATSRTSVTGAAMYESGHMVACNGDWREKVLYHIAVPRRNN